MTEFGPKSPSRKLQPDSVRLHSPLALTGAFIYMLREYFKLGLTNWEWKDNLTASDIFISISTSDKFEEFLTLPSYKLI